MTKDKKEWRNGLKAGDLVMMKHGGMALVTEVIRHAAEPRYAPHIKMIFCDDGEPGSCSSYRVERLMNEGR
jgi:hypothetical protein